MKGFNKFQLAMIKAARIHLYPLFEEGLDTLGEALWNHIFSLSGPTVVNRKLTDRDRFFGKIFRGFLEISKSLETLEDISFYVGRFPFQKTRITAENYLRFHVEAWFAEMYILRERLTSYLKVVERQYKRDPHFSTIQARCRSLGDLITKTLQDVIALRGQHIHENRFSDDDMDRLDTLELLTHDLDDVVKSLMHLHHRIEHRKVRRAWKDRIVANNKAVRELIDVFFDVLFPVVFDEESQALKYPKRFKT
jgi:hypothetical protein